MLERRESILREKLTAASEQLEAAQARYMSALAELSHVEAVQSAQVGDFLSYVVRGQAGGGHVIGKDGESFILMSGPVEARDIRRVNARYIVEVVRE